MLPPTIVDAGFRGNLTLEILSMGYDGNNLPPAPPVGERFAHLIFARTTGPCVPYRGKYAGQTGITEAREEIKDRPDEGMDQTPDRPSFPDGPYRYQD